MKPKEVQVLREEAHLYSRMTKMEMVLKLLCKSGCLSQRSVSLTAGSCPIKVVKGQQLPWKDKPGKTPNWRLQTTLKPFSMIFIGILRTTIQHLAEGYGELHL